MTCPARSRKGTTMLLLPTLLIVALVQMNCVVIARSLGEDSDKDADLEHVLALSSDSVEHFDSPDAQPHKLTTIRGKRSGISDQRLAELETLLALQKFRDQQMRTRVPVAYGVFDPDRIGKRRRRATRHIDAARQSRHLADAQRALRHRRALASLFAN